jgi:hypothetical protein
LSKKLRKKIIMYWLISWGCSWSPKSNCLLLSWLKRSHILNLRW